MLAIVNRKPARNMYKMFVPFCDCNQASCNIFVTFVVDADWVAGSSPFTKVEATGDTESTSSKSEDGGDEGEEITEFFSYDRLKSTSTDPALKINIKRKEVYIKLRCPAPSVSGLNAVGG